MAMKRLCLPSNRIAGIRYHASSGITYAANTSVALSFVVGRELAAISGARPYGCRFHLHAEKVWAVLDADVVGLRVSPRLADGETALRGSCHELQLNPFAALFEVAESIPVVLAVLADFLCSHSCAHPL
jgi:hypothetical protein